MGVAKLALRDQLLAARRHLPLPSSASARERSRGHLLEAPEVRRAATVAAYVSVSSEPGTGPLLDAAARAGKRVILPVLQPDNDLDWAAYDGPERLRSAATGAARARRTVARGRRRGHGRRRARARASPSDRDGMRLGRGGGCYDRALGRVPVGTFVCVLLNSEEVLDSVPREDHDRPVNAVATEHGIRRLT